jgi:putative endonuclease
VAKALSAGRAPRGAAAGAEGEGLACGFLEGLGYRVLARNFRCRAGEVDIVARAPDGTIAFVEVKHRRGTSHGAGYEAVTFGKRQRLVRAARFFAAGRGLMEASLRFDVVSIDCSAGAPVIRHDEGAFDADGG